MNNSKLILASFVIVIMTVFMGFRLWNLERNCSNLDLSRIKLASASYFVDKYGIGTIGFMNAEGSSSNFEKVPYGSAIEYLEKYPDCCRYYPNEYKGQGFSLWEKLTQPYCGFVGVTGHTQYLDQNTVKVAEPTGRVWLIDHRYKIHKDPKDR
ncbi:hypothetical protein [Roseibium sp. TrichSKD4]|uniref:hypothetical protein n=1 Tax=Roseibium sp. TrichSKD4 TaxID=744980 RepID=UPI00058EC290|nr:hypothetical protein [Roseibium sp. TrichSKD4]